MSNTTDKSIHTKIRAIGSFTEHFKRVNLELLKLRTLFHFKGFKLFIHFCPFAALIIHQDLHHHSTITNLLDLLQIRNQWNLQDVLAI